MRGTFGPEQDRSRIGLVLRNVQIFFFLALDICCFAIHRTNAIAMIHQDRGRPLEGPTVLTLPRPQSHCQYVFQLVEQLFSLVSTGSSVSKLTCLCQSLVVLPIGDNHLRL